MAVLAVQLKKYELEMAVGVGERRHIAALARGSAPRFAERKVGELWVAHIEGACAEYAVAKNRGWCWSGHVDVYHEPDFVVDGVRYEVRWTAGERVKVRPDDVDVVIVGVSGQAPKMRIMGGILAEDAKRPEWYCDREPVCWFVPFAALRSLDEVRRAQKRS